jgi:hypothetical protein
MRHVLPAPFVYGAPSWLPHLSRHGGQVPQALLQVYAALKQGSPVAADDGRQLLEHSFRLLLTVQLQKQAKATHDTDVSTTGEGVKKATAP